MEKYIPKTLQKNAKVCIYGTGSYGHSIKEILKEKRNDVNIVSFINSFKSGEFEGYTVVTPDGIKYLDFDMIIIASAYFKEIEETLKSTGIDTSVILNCNNRYFFKDLDRHYNYLTYTACPICNNKDIEPETNSIYKCNNCSHKFAKIIMDDKSTIESSYSDIGYWYADKVHQSIFTIDDGSQWKEFITARKNTLEKLNFFKGLKLHESRIFEVGCSEGMFIKYLNQLGYKAFGCEANREIVLTSVSKLCVPIINDTIENINIEDKTIDGIISFHVFEHLCDPRAVLERCFHMLKKNGKMLITVPIDDKEEGNTDHYHFFTTKSIYTLFNQFFVDINHNIEHYIAPSGEVMGCINIIGTKQH